VHPESTASRWRRPVFGTKPTCRPALTVCVAGETESRRGPVKPARNDPNRSLATQRPFVGVVVLAAEPGLSGNTLPLLLVVGAAFAFAVSNILTKRYGPFDPLMLMGWSSLLTVPQVMLMSLLIEHG
jgi:hypothetical protein